MAPPPPPALPTTMAGDLPQAIIKLQATFHKWQQVDSNAAEYGHLTEEILTSCNTIASKVGTMRDADEKGKSYSAMARNEDLIATSRPLSCSSHGNDDYTASELVRPQDDEIHELSASVQRTGGGGLSIHDDLSRQDSLFNQQDYPAENNHPCVPLDEASTIATLKIVSTAALPMIAALSTYSARTVAPLASGRLTQEVLLISPYVCIPLASIGIALSFCASESNGLAECGSVALLLVCLFCEWLGALAVAILLHVAKRSVKLWTYVLTLFLIHAWGWLFSYPRFLKFHMRMLYWDCFDGRRSTHPRRAAYADPGTGQHTDKKGLHRILSACQRACVPLNEDMSIDIIKKISGYTLTAMITLTLWAAQTVAPQASSVTLQGFLYTQPYPLLPLGLAAVALAVGASKSNGLASYASSFVLVLCVCVVALGACCIAVLLQFGRLLFVLIEVVLVVALITAWGWMLAYPKMLNYAVRKTCCLSCAHRLRIIPLGRFEGCDRNSWAWTLSILKSIGIYMVFFPSRFVAVCLRFARRWRRARYAPFAADHLDLEEGAAGLEMTPLRISDL